MQKIRSADNKGDLNRYQEVTQSKKESFPTIYVITAPAGARSDNFSGHTMEIAVSMSIQAELMVRVQKLIGQLFTVDRSAVRDAIITYLLGVLKFGIFR